MSGLPTYWRPIPAIDLPNNQASSPCCAGQIGDVGCTTNFVSPVLEEWSRVDGWEWGLECNEINDASLSLHKQHTSTQPQLSITPPDNVGSVVLEKWTWMFVPHAWRHHAGIQVDTVRGSMNNNKNRYRPIHRNKERNSLTLIRKPFKLEGRWLWVIETWQVRSERGYLFVALRTERR